jgi:hypothetical protein
VSPRVLLRIYTRSVCKVVLKLCRGPSARISDVSYKQALQLFHILLLNPDPALESGALVKGRVQTEKFYLNTPQKLSTPRNILQKATSALNDVWRGVAIPSRGGYKCGQPLPSGLFYDHVQ